MTVPPVYRYDPTRDDDLTPRPGFTAIYGLFDPGTLALRYIGKAVNPQKRLKEHWNHAFQEAKTPLKFWLRKWRLLDTVTPMQIIEWVPDDEWIEAECRHIAAALAAGCDLKNTHPGGKGPAGAKFSDEHKAKLAAANKKRWSDPAYREKMTALLRNRKYSPEAMEHYRLAGLRGRGRKVSDEGRKNISDGHKGLKHTPEHIAKNVAARKKNAKPRTPEQRAKMSARMSGRTMSAESSEKKRLAMLGKEQTAETKAKISAGNTGKKRSPETIEGMRSRATGKVRSESSRAKQSAAMMGRKSSPESIAKALKSQLITMADPEVRQRMSEAKKRAWSDPEKKEAMLAKRRATVAAKKAQSSE